MTFPGGSLMASCCASPAFRPMTRTKATIAAELGETSKGSDHYRVLFLIGVLLFSITFAVNLTADLIVKGIRKK